MMRGLIFLLLSATDALQLHVKAGPDGKSNGDCPFAHAIRIALDAKQLAVDVVPHAPDAKPDWLVNDHGGKMPCLRDTWTE